MKSKKKTTNTMSYLQSLDYEDGIGTVTSLLKYWPMQYVTTLGLDGKPKIRPLEYKFEEDGVLYFDTVDFYTSYKEMQAYPYITLCIGDQETMSYLTVTGKVNFIYDEDIINKCFENSEVLTSQFGNNRSHVSAYYLTECKSDFATFVKELGNHHWDLSNKFD